jgi:hypothetical protein
MKKKKRIKIKHPALKKNSNKKMITSLLKKKSKIKFKNEKRKKKET